MEACRPAAGFSRERSPHAETIEACKKECNGSRDAPKDIWTETEKGLEKKPFRLFDIFAGTFVLPDFLLQADVWRADCL